MSDLQKLAQNREALLLAEVAAWLHDDFKHTDQHIKTHVTGAPVPSGRQDVEDLIPNRSVSLLGQSLPFSDVKKRRRADFVADYLQRCHYTAHIEKQDGDGNQSYPAFLSSAFGFENEKSKIPGNLTRDLRSKISWPLLGQVPFTDKERAELYKQIIALFSRVGGDTRRPTNEITLWEWVHTVGALYKSALAGALLGFQPQKDNLRWRLFSVRFDGFAYFAEGYHLPDLLARRSILQQALDLVRGLLEVTFPLGAEVYRDENGSVFVVPGCEKQNCTLDILSLADANETLHQKITQNLQKILEGELVPELTLDTEPWWGQDPARRDNDELPPVADHLSITVFRNDPEWVTQQWNTNEQICSVCGLRPQGPSPKAIGRNVCDVCERRRADRSKEWALSKLDTTIWTNEVADINGRLALIVGQFDLTHWLGGTLIQSMTVAAPPSSSRDNITKNPSFARVRRIWETTRQFWQNRLTADTFSQAGPRLEIIPANADHLDLGHYHVYDLVLTAGSKLSVVWDEKNKRFITAENLEYLGKPEQLGESVKIWLADRRGQHLILEEPTGYGSANKEWGKIEIQDVREIPNSSYIPAIPILAEPRTFMALVPANKALDVVRGIKTKYEREMGKVRNRLPLHLGIVYAHRRTPLRTVLDAGRRMLQQNALVVDAWRVDEVRREQTGPLPPKAQVLSDGTQQFNKWHAIKLKNTKLNCSLTWYVPAVMGDGETEDHWYPYVYLNSQSEPSDRQRYFKAPNPWTGKNGWLVHAGELKNGDQIYFTPATLDFQWLDTAGRRFEIAYDESGKRLRSLTKPFMLDELDTLNDMWATLSNHLSKNQIYAIRDEIELKREAWQPSPEDCQKDGMFRKFCLDILANAAWQKFKGSYPWGNEGLPAQGWLDTWADYAARGWLNDVVELHLQIMKEKMHTENREGVLS